MICNHLFKEPEFSEGVFIAPGANVIGDVTLGKNSSIWYQAVLRADIEKIVIGEGCNVQDGSVIHMSSELGTNVGNFVTIGHRALLHACSIDDECLIGMGAIIMDGARIGSQCIIGAGSLVTRDSIIPDGSLVIGSPAKVIKSLDQEGRNGIRNWALKYIEVAREHRKKLQVAPKLH